MPSLQDVHLEDELNFGRLQLPSGTQTASSNLRVMWKSVQASENENDVLSRSLPPSSSSPTALTSFTKSRNLHLSSKPLQHAAAEIDSKTTANLVSSSRGPPTSPRYEKSTSSALQKGTFGRVRVVVRCRPLLPTDAANSSERLYVDRQHVMIRQSQTYSGKRFTFDRVLSPESTQQDVFIEVLPLIDHALNGLNATVFAYGQTGSGKTFTMDGLQYVVSPSLSSNGVVGKDSVILPDTTTPVERHGVLPRVIQMMYDVASLREREGIDSETGEPKEGAIKYSFKCSFLQIYNEKITDLLQSGGAAEARNLDKSKTTTEKKKTVLGGNTKTSGNPHNVPAFGAGLRLRWCKGDVFRVQNLFLCECESAQAMRNAFYKGVKEKVMASHIMNVQSSRSHCIFTIYVIRSDARTGDVVGRSEFSLVDLAGSEKLSAITTDHRTAIAKESIDINTSLLALGKVIVALSNAKGANASAHIPYRESNLTKLLKHSLGGNSLTTMIACISPSDAHVEESVSTLLYAGRAKNIENEPHVNEDPNFSIIRDLRDEVRQLKEELKYYRALVQNGLIRSEENAKRDLSHSASSSLAVGSGDQSNLISTSGNVGNSDGGSFVHGKDEGMLLMEKNQLAESLISACEMLQHIIGVNSQLRGAHDVLKGDAERAGVREMYLNAENLALRERIEMLESIVLNEEFMKVKTENNFSSTLQLPDSHHTSRSCSTCEHNESVPEYSLEETAVQMEKEVETKVGSSEGKERVPKLTNDERDDLLLSPQQSLPPHRPPHKPLPSQAVGTALSSMESDYDDVFRQEGGEEEEEKRNQKNFKPFQTAGVHRSRDLDSSLTCHTPQKGEQDEQEKRHHRHAGTPSGWKRGKNDFVGSLQSNADVLVMEKVGSSSSTASFSSSSSFIDDQVRHAKSQKKHRSAQSREATAAPPRSGGDRSGRNGRLSDSLLGKNRAPSASAVQSSSKGKQSSRIPGRVGSSRNGRSVTSSHGGGGGHRHPSAYHYQIARQLAEYDRRYRHPLRPSTYAEYYGKSGGASLRPPPSSSAATRSTGRNTSSKQSMAAIQLMDSVLRALPREVVKEVVPASLKKSEKFGKLSFGGPTKEIEDFQQRRSEREEKLRRLLEKNRELNSMVQKEIATPILPSGTEDSSRSSAISSKRQKNLFSLSFPGVAYSEPNKRESPSRHNRPINMKSSTENRQGSRNGILRQALEHLHEKISLDNPTEMGEKHFSSTSRRSPPTGYPPSGGRLSSLKAEARPSTVGNPSHTSFIPYAVQSPSGYQRYTSHSFDMELVDEDDDGAGRGAGDALYPKGERNQKYSNRR